MLIGLSLSESKFDFSVPGSSRINRCLTVILTLRTWAVWNRDKRLTIILPILYFLFWGSGFIIRGIYLSDIKGK